MTYTFKEIIDIYEIGKSIKSLVTGRVFKYSEENEPIQLISRIEMKGKWCCDDKK